MPTREEIEAAWEYARRYYRDQEVEDTFRLLAEYVPGVFRGYMTLREGVFPLEGEGDSVLPAKVKELVILGVEIAAMMSPPPVYHARKAIEAGATPQEVAEVVALCIMLRGMMSYQQSGRFVLEEAHRRAAERAGAAAAASTDGREGSTA